MAKNFVAMESDLDKYVEDKVNSLIGGGGISSLLIGSDKDVIQITKNIIDKSINHASLWLISTDPSTKLSKIMINNDKSYKNIEILSSAANSANSAGGILKAYNSTGAEKLTLFADSRGAMVIQSYGAKNTGAITIAGYESDYNTGYITIDKDSSRVITLDGNNGAIATTGDISGRIVNSSSDMQCNGNSCIYNGNHLLVYNNDNSEYTFALRGSDGYVRTNGNISAAGAISTNSYGKFGSIRTGKINIKGQDASIELYSSISGYIDWHKDGSTGDFTSRLIENIAGSLYLYSTGGQWGWFHAGGFANDSSRVVKKNIKDISENDALKLLKLRPVSFDYKNGDTNRRGLIAEEVMEVYPELVKIPEGYDEDTFEFKEDGTNLVPSLEYTGLIPYLIKMVQIQQKEIEGLKKKQ